jgi:hypothetical protein
MENEDSKPEPMRCAIVVDVNLPPGRAANAAAVIALTIGQRHPNLVGAALLNCLSLKIAAADVRQISSCSRKNDYLIGAVRIRGAGQTGRAGTFSNKGPKPSAKVRCAMTASRSFA